MHNQRLPSSTVTDCLLELSLPTMLRPETVFYFRKCHSRGFIFVHVITRYYLYLKKIYLRLHHEVICTSQFTNYINTNTKLLADTLENDISCCIFHFKMIYKIFSIFFAWACRYVCVCVYIYQSVHVDQQGFLYCNVLPLSLAFGIFSQVTLIHYCFD